MFSPVSSGDEIGRRILLVEDGPDNQRLINHVLRKPVATKPIDRKQLVALAARYCRAQATPVVTP